MHVREIFIFTYLYIFLNIYKSVYLDVFPFICILLYMWLCSTCSNASPVVFVCLVAGPPSKIQDSTGRSFVLFWWPISHIRTMVLVYLPTKLGDLCWANVGKYSSKKWGIWVYIYILYLYCVKCTGRFDVIYIYMYIYIYVWVLSQPPQPSDPHNNGWDSPKKKRPHIFGEGQLRGFPLYHTISSLQHIPIIPDFSARILLVKSPLMTVFLVLARYPWQLTRSGPPVMFVAL